MKAHGIALALLLAVLLVGCYSATTEPAAEPASVVAAPQGQQSPPSAQEVVIKGFRFEPATLTVPIGTTITWTNEDAATHTIKGSDFVSDNVPTGRTYERTFSQPGTYEYICGIHPSMRGTIVVQ